MFWNCYEGLASNLKLSYPSTSKRSLGIAGEDSRNRDITKFERSRYAKLENSAIMYTDGPAFETYGPGYNTMNNTHLYFIDWSVTDISSIDQTVKFTGTGNVFSHNTVELAGASSTIIPGDAATVEFNNIFNVARLQTDCSGIHLMMPHQSNTIIKNNWVHDFPGYAQFGKTKKTGQKLKKNCLGFFRSKTLKTSFYVLKVLTSKTQKNFF